MNRILAFGISLIFLTPVAYGQETSPQQISSDECSVTTNSLQPKKMSLDTIEQSSTEDTAEATVKVALVLESCSGNFLASIPELDQSSAISGFLLQVSTSRGELLYQSDLFELSLNSSEVVTIGVPRIYASNQTELEIRVIAKITDNRLNIRDQSLGSQSFAFQVAPR